jgi:hypothetical protein
LKVDGNKRKREVLAARINLARDGEMEARAKRLGG